MVEKQGGLLNQVIGAICMSGSYCWGLSIVTSSEASLQALSRFGSKPGNSPE